MKSDSEKLKENNDLKSKKSQKSAINKTENEIGFQIYLAETKMPNKKKCRKEWKSLSSEDKRAYINKLPVQYATRRKIQLFPTNEEKANDDNIKTNEKSKNYKPTKISMEIQRLIGLPASYLFQPVCSHCEKYLQEIKAEKCQGNNCGQYIHPQCAYKGNSSLCRQCANGDTICTFCRNTNEECDSYVMCEVENCYKMYHKQCLKFTGIPYLNIKKNTVRICPAHFCITCVSENGLFNQCYSRKLIQCIRCCNSYHLYDLCTAAGSSEVSLSHIICPRHFQTSLNKDSRFTTVNISYCCVCYTSNAEVKCQFCPNAYHNRCLNATEQKNSIICSECKKQSNPRIASVQFVKLSQYRWWPCEVIHLRNGPLNLVRMGWVDGSFLVRFLGTNEYQYISKGRCLSYNLAVKINMNKETGSNVKFSKQFNAGLKEAAKIHQVYVNILKRFVPLLSMDAPEISEVELNAYINCEEDRDSSPMFELLHHLKPMGLKLEQTKVPVCKCTADVCSPPSCSNYINKIQCDISFCPSGSKCKNQIFIPLDKNDVGVFKTPDRGHSLTVLVDIIKDQFISEYVGDVITEKEAENRMQKAVKSKVKDFYMFQLDNDKVIDAGYRGNLTRFINHSCNPNCYVEKWLVNGYYRLGIFAMKDVRANEELTINYHISGALQKGDRFCLCGAAECIGYLKGSIKSKTSNIQSKSPKKNENVEGAKKEINVQENNQIAVSKKSTPKSSVMERRASKRLQPKDESKESVEIIDDKVAADKATKIIDQPERRMSTRLQLTQKIPPVNEVNNFDRSNCDVTLLKDNSINCDNSKSPTTLLEPSDNNNITVKTKECEVKKNILLVAEVNDVLESETVDEIPEKGNDADVKDVVCDEVLVTDQSENIDNDLTIEHNKVASTKVKKNKKKSKKKKDRKTNLEAPVNTIDSKDEVKDEECKSLSESIKLDDNKKLVYNDDVKEITAPFVIVDSERPSLIIMNSSDSVKHSKTKIESPPHLETISSIRKNDDLEIIERQEIFQKVSESFCYRCFDGGELVVCDKPFCPKAYHVGCIGVDDIPDLKSIRWFCPWHFCVKCGKRSVALCTMCPRSFCKVHDTIENVAYRLKRDSGFIHCKKHTEEMLRIIRTSIES